MRSIASLVLTAALTASAGAQCNLYLNGLPDFDQRRAALPNAGAMYCVPTSAINLMGYAANRGVPSALDGPRNWQSQTNYNFVSDRIAIMGALMGTDPFDGTGGSGGEAGLEFYLLINAPNKFTVTRYYGDYGVGNLVYHWLMGNLVNVCYGYYPVSNGLYYRDGGHCVTLSGIINYCDDEFRLRWRDPASDSDNLNTQSTFANKFSDASRQIFIATDGYPRNRIRLWDLGVNSTTRRYLDSYISVNPLVALAGGVTQTDSVMIHRPVRIIGLTPPSGQVKIPGDDPIIHIALGAQPFEAFIVTSQISPRQQKVFRHNLATGETQEILSSSTAMRITTSRHGHLFVYGDGSVRKYNIIDDRLVLEQEAPTPAALTAMTYDDARDEVVATTSTGRFVRYPQDLTLPAINEPLPSGVQTTGSMSIAIDEGAQKYYVCGSGDPTIYVLGLVPGTPRLRIESSLLLPAVQSPEDLQFTDEGTLVVLSNGVIGEFSRGATGGWTPKQDSVLAGLPGAGGLAVARSRSNFMAGVHDTPEWRNVLVDEGVPDVPDCDADFNNDGFLNSQDFFDYLLAFFAQEARADFNGDGTVNSQDFFDFLRVFFEGC